MEKGLVDKVEKGQEIPSHTIDSGLFSAPLFLCPPP